MVPLPKPAGAQPVDSKFRSEPRHVTPISIWQFWLKHHEEPVAEGEILPTERNPQPVRAARPYRILVLGS